MRFDQWHAMRSVRCMAEPMSAEALNGITSAVIAAAIRIHRALGPGLLESAYLACLAHELTAAALRIDLQRQIPLRYRGITVPCAYRADMIVDGSLIVEVKAIDQVAGIHVRQLHTYVRLAGCPVGLLLNFGAPTMKAGITRVVNGFPDRRGEMIGVE